MWNAGGQRRGQLESTPGGSALNEAVPAPLTVAVTGPTGTLGFGLVPLLQDSDRVGRVIGIARRPFDPEELGWTKMEYRRGDVRSTDVLEDAFDRADVVVHLAFMITGAASRESIREINVEGTLNAFRAAATAGAKRFVYASSVAAYGFHRDNPVGMTEDWPVRPAAHLFYAQEKAELEQLLQDEDQRHPDLGLYMVRPPIVLGPHAMGAKDVLPDVLDPVAGRLSNLVRGGLPVPLPVPVPDLPVQFIHEDDVGQALLLSALGAGPPGAYNIAGDGVLSAPEVARELGLLPLPVPGGPVQSVARLAAALPELPGAPPLTGWIEAFSHPAIMDTSRAKRELGWSPRYSGLEALRDTLRHP
jgi:nucleoside-diphosphate-sugar epimerase